MTSTKKKFENQSGSAVRHVAVLLALGMVCYFGVKAFYHRVDSSFPDRRAQPLQSVVTETRETGQDRDNPGGIDKEAITRRNLFLSGKREGGSGLTSLNGNEVRQPDLLLVGTIVETDGLNRAVVLDVEQKTQHLLREGDMIKGASVRRIDSGRVIISRQGQNELLDIAEAAKVRAATTELIAPDKTDRFGTRPVSVTTDQEEENEAEGGSLRVDLDRLGKTDGKIIIKGRISNNI